MQRMFAEHTEWHLPWMRRVIPGMRRIGESHASQTVFTRFIPASYPGEETQNLETLLPTLAGNDALAPGP
jgi:hypothetical protein